MRALGVGLVLVAILWMGFFTGPSYAVEVSPPGTGLALVGMAVYLAGVALDSRRSRRAP